MPHRASVCSRANPRAETQEVPARAFVTNRAQRASARLGSWLLALSALLVAACGGSDDAGHKDEGDVVTEWDPGGSALSNTLHKEKLFESVADALNDGFKFPRDLPIVHTSCGEENAFYDPNSGQLLMCYELLESISKISQDLVAQGSAQDEDELGERIVGTWMFVFFHELGHGLVDLYQLPITGKEEDVVDEFSTLLMIEADLAEYAAYAADYWQYTDTGMYDESSFADEHSLNSQRFYNILCLIYGSDPDKYEVIVTGGFLPEARAARCPAEYVRKKQSWDTLLEPWEK